MATAKKLPSGSWRVRVYSHTEEVLQPDGTKKEKKIYKSFTCDDPTPRGKRKCEAEAAEWAKEKETKTKSESLTFQQALNNYISSRENVLSPTTLREYKSIKNNYIRSLMNIKIDSITQDDIQKAINIESLTHSPKTVRNIHGLISATLKVYRPSMALNTALPKKKRVKLYIPTDHDVQKLLKYVEGTEMELPVLLAAFGPMRRGEICAVESSDIKGNIVHVCKNLVRKEDGSWIVKEPKSYSGDRYIEYPDFVAEKWKGIDGRLVKLLPHQITNRFGDILERAGISHFRFHDLRHYSASILHALGIPDVYIMQRGGWGNDGTLKAVYRHALSDKMKEANDTANKHFSELYDTKYDTK